MKETVDAILAIRDMGGTFRLAEVSGKSYAVGAPPVVMSEAQRTKYNALAMYLNARPDEVLKALREPEQPISEFIEAEVRYMTGIGEVEHRAVMRANMSCLKKWPVAFAEYRRGIE